MVEKKKIVKGILVIVGVVFALLSVVAVVAEAKVSKGVLYRTAEAGRYIVNIPVRSTGWGYVTNVDVYVAVDVISAGRIVGYLSTPYEEIPHGEWAQLGFGGLDIIAYKLLRFRLGSLGSNWMFWGNSAEAKLAIEFDTVIHSVQFPMIKIMYEGIRNSGVIDVGSWTLVRR